MTLRAGSRTRLRIACCAATAAALLAIGCGADSESDQANTTPTASTATRAALTKAEFISQADKACTVVQRKQNDLRRKTQGKQTTELVPALREQAKLATGLANDLKTYGTPSGDSARVAAFIDSVRQIGVYSKALGNSIEAKHTGPARNLAKKLRQWREVEHTLGQRYGFKVCARGSSY